MMRALLFAGFVAATLPAFAQTQTRPVPPPMVKAGAAAKKLDPAPTLIGGHALLASGRPAAGALIHFRWQDAKGGSKEKLLTADGTGAFSFLAKLPAKSNPVQIEITAGVPGKGIVSALVVSDSASLARLALKLQPPVRLVGRILRSDGQPASGIAVHARHMMVVQSSAGGSSREEPERLAIQQAQAGIPESQLIGAADKIGQRWSTQTDASGRFAMEGLPSRGQVFLTPEAGLAMAAGSAGVIRLGSRDHRDIGTLIAVRPGKLHLRVVDKATGLPVPGISAQPIQGFGQRRVFASAQFDDTEIAPDFGGNSNAHGEITISRLLPGDYNFEVGGRLLPVHIQEGETTTPGTISLRRGSLQIKLTGPDQKPAADAVIGITLGTPRNLQADLTGSMDRDGRAVQKTRADGTFTLANVPWGAAAVTIRATRGSEMAEWTGPADSLGSSLDLKLRPNALVTVTGRLLDPERRPLGKFKFESLHWLDSPRSTWFATAHVIDSDAQGRFRVAGLERGEAFSLVTAPGQQAQQQAQEVHPAADQGRLVAASFESPRFTTSSSQQQQELGDVVVHPIQDPGEIMQIYGDSDPLQQARLTGFLPSPSSEDVDAARQVLAKYLTGTRSGNIATVMALTSRLSGGWSPERRSFLERCSVASTTECTPLDKATVRPVSMVPRGLGALVAQFGSADLDMVSEPDMKAGIRAVELNPQFVFFQEMNAQTVGLAGVLRKEDGEWKVIALPGEMIELGNRALFSQSVAAPTRQMQMDYASSAPALDAASQAAAEQLVLKYLKFWGEDRTASMLSLTAPVSPLFSQGEDIKEHKRRLAARADEGVCPVSDVAALKLEPVAGLSAWDFSLLCNQIGMDRAESRRNGFMGNRGEIGKELSGFSRRGDAAIFRYTADDQQFLVLLVRYDGKWMMIEPALRL